MLVLSTGLRILLLPRALVLPATLLFQKLFLSSDSTGSGRSLPGRSHKYRQPALRLLHSLIRLTMRIQTAVLVSASLGTCPILVWQTKMRLTGSGSGKGTASASGKQLQPQLPSMTGSQRGPNVLGASSRPMAPGRRPRDQMKNSMCSPRGWSGIPWGSLVQCLHQLLASQLTELQTDISLCRMCQPAAKTQSATA